MTKVYSIPAFSDNYIWLITDDAMRHSCVVDPGDASVVIERLDNYNLNLDYILLTHHHFDHSGGVLDLKSKYNCQVFGPDNKKLPFIDTICDETTIVNLDKINLKLEVLTIPGHTLDHIAFYGDGLIFSGDTLFLGGCGRVFEGTPDMMLNSLNKIAFIDEEYLVYCGHEYTLKNLEFALTVEPSNTILQNRYNDVKAMREKNLVTVPASLLLEKQTNPFLRCMESEIIASALKSANKQLSNPVEVFAEIRQMKDKF